MESSTSDFDTVVKQLEYQAAEELANDLLRASDTICRKNVRALQAKLQAEYDELLRAEIQKRPQVSEATAQEEGEWRLRNVLRSMREKLLAYGVQQEELRRERDKNILKWIKEKME